MEDILTSMQQIIPGHRGGPRGKKANARATAQRNPTLAKASAEYSPADYSPLNQSAHDHDRHMPAPEFDWGARRVVGEHANTIPAKNAGTLEDLVVERLRPMFKSWLDECLPALVEQLVQEQIQRLSSPARRPQSIHKSQLEAQKREPVLASAARADFPRNKVQPLDDSRSGHLPLSQVEMYTELLSAELDRSRDRTMKELEIQGSRLLEAFSKQGKSIAIALDNSVRHRLDTFSAQARSIVVALDRTESAVTTELPKTVSRLGEMNRSIQSAAARLGEQLATAEAALSNQSATLRGSPQAATRDIGQMATCGSVDAIAPASNQVAPSITKTEATPQKHSDERRELYAGDELQGSVDQGGVAANKVGLTVPRSLIEELETIDKLWKTGASSGEDLKSVAAQASISSLRLLPTSEPLFPASAAAEPLASEGVERLGELVPPPASSNDKVAKANSPGSSASNCNTQNDHENRDSWVRGLLRRTTSSGEHNILILATFCFAAAVTYWL